MADPFAPPSKEELLFAQNEAMASAFAPPSEEELAIADSESGASTGTHAQAALEGFGDSSTFGFLPEIQAAAEPGMTALFDQLTGQDVGSDLPDYDTRVAENEARQAMLSKEAPAASVAGQLGGALAGGGAVGAGVRGATKLAAPKLAAALAKGAQSNNILASAGSRLAQNLPEGAVISALGGTASGDVSGAIKQGAAIDTAISLAGPVARVGKKGAKLAMSRIFGPSVKSIDDFLERAPQINALRDKEEIGELAQKAVDDLVSKNASEFQQARDSLFGAVKLIESDAGQLADDAVDALGKANVKIPKKKLIDTIRSSKSQIPRIGDVPVDEFAESAENSIDALAKRAELFPDELSGADVKAFVNSIRQKLKFTDPNLLNNPNANSVTDRALKSVQHQLNESLRDEVPEFARLMDESASKFRFLGEVKRRFKRIDNIESAIKDLPRNKVRVKDQVLRKLAERGDVDLSKLEQIQRDTRLFNSFTDGRAADKFNALVSKESELMKTRFGRLGEMADQDFIQLANDYRTAGAFAENLAKDTRKFGLWTVMLGVGGGVSSGGAIGALGLAVGAILDSKGPAIAKRMLTGISKLKGIPTVPKIMRLDIPQDAKEELVNQFRRAVVARSTTESVTHIPPSLVADVSSEIQRDKGMSNTEKAKAIDQLNKEGTVNDITRIMDPDPPKEDRKPAVEQRKNKTSALDLKKFNSNLSKLARKPEY